MGIPLRDKKIESTDIVKLKDIKRVLSQKFLFENDVTCIQILLNIYNIEDSIENVFPSYISLKHLKKDIRRFLRNKDGKELIAYNLSQLIHDDINRFELYLYLEGYRNGFHCPKCANRLEILTFHHFTVEELYGMKTLFQYETKRKDILAFKDTIFKGIEDDIKVNKFLKNVIYRYNRTILRKKIYNLNNHLDRQLMINYESSDEKFTETNNILTQGELKGLNRKLTRFLFLDGLRIYQNAYWHGVNDQVINRYQ
ncbi:MAG: hypothetical protein Q4Q07_02130 [Tissierellia bacterium]|nr:hypothetical protein [Tissierellia bacterium]